MCLMGNLFKLVVKVIDRRKICQRHALGKYWYERVLHIFGIFRSFAVWGISVYRNSRCIYAGMMAVGNQKERIPSLYRLADGQLLAVWECGDPKGRPLFYCHGWPSAGSQGLLADQAARESGWHVYAPSRPGIGWSAFQPGRKITDWGRTTERLLDHLGLRRCSLLAVSGGCPYALAAAAHLSDRVQQVFIVSGAAPAPALLGSPETLFVYRWLLSWQQRHPALCRTVLGALGSLADERLIFSLSRQMRPMLAEPDRILLRSSHLLADVIGPVGEALARGGRGVAWDGSLYAFPWEIDFVRIDCPVTFWHGGRDRNIPPLALEKLFRQIPQAKLRLFPEEGHYSLPITRIGEIFDALDNLNDQ